jgi:transcriptional regulator with XRE-family HTH domain
MIGKSDILKYSDNAIALSLSEFIRQKRLAQNKTQSELAEAAGINRSTLIEFEQSGRANMLTFIQLLRALDQLQMLQVFQVEKELSPIQLAELQQAEKKRASKSKDKKQNKKSDW